MDQDWKVIATCDMCGTVLTKFVELDGVEADRRVGVRQQVVTRLGVFCSNCAPIAGYRVDYLPTHAFFSDTLFEN